MNARTFVILTAICAFGVPGERLTLTGVHAVRFDQNGRVVPNGAPAAIKRMRCYRQAGGSIVFSPNAVNISVGDTVRWTWGSSFHGETSGLRVRGFSVCSPNDTNCPAGTLDQGAV
jgi:hypothetical protein